MIGVIADGVNERIIEEFFELFKTPWEFYQQDSEYDVLLCAGGAYPTPASSRLIIHYTVETTGHTFPHEHPVVDSATARTALYKEQRLPLYKKSLTFRAEDALALHDETSHLPLSHITQSNQHKTITIGYQLFHEVAYLLSHGQPEAYAIIPTLDHHIALLRDLIVSHGIELVEIPPIPIGYPFIACLTHDVDHPMLRPHLWDRTAVGLCYRAFWGSLLGAFRSRITLPQLWRNLCMLGSLPLVWLGIRQDPWTVFAEAYEELEGELPSTYFFLPFKACPGRMQQGEASGRRAAKYGASDLAGTIQAIRFGGNEVGLHGIDAWIDAEAGRTELQEIRQLAATPNPGVRMHWLYFNQDSPQELESAGASYDSTAGYNGAIGYRAGTAQAYVSPSVKYLMELPLHIMDTALFYPAHMHLAQDEAEKWIAPIIDHACKMGGCVTVNWHDRSLLPERLWDSSYRVLIKNLRHRGAWFATGSQAVAWFRKRRAVTFAHPSSTNDCLISQQDNAPNLPELRLRIWNHPLFKSESSIDHQTYFDMSLQTYQAMSQTSVTNCDTPITSTHLDSRQPIV